MKNRDKILQAATRLFNASGFVNVRLQHISDDTIISVGNIAYHFKNKEAIVRCIFEELEKKHKEVLIEYRHTPIFMNVDRIFLCFEEIQKEYSFFYTDIIEIKRAYPELFGKIMQFFQWQILLFEEIIRFNTARGAMKKRLKQEDIHFLATLVTQNINSWKSFSLTWKEDTQSEQENLSLYVWKILIPYMTEAGMEEYLVLKEMKIKLYDQA